MSERRDRVTGVTWATGENQRVLGGWLTGYRHLLGERGRRKTQAASLTQRQGRR